MKCFTWLHVPGRYVCVVPRGDNVRPLRPFYECCVRTLCPCAHIMPVCAHLTQRLIAVRPSINPGMGGHAMVLRDVQHGTWM